MPPPPPYQVDPSQHQPQPVALTTAAWSRCFDGPYLRLDLDFTYTVRASTCSRLHRYSKEGRLSSDSRTQLFIFVMFFSATKKRGNPDEEDSSSMQQDGEEEAAAVGGARRRVGTRDPPHDPNNNPNNNPNPNGYY